MMKKMIMSGQKQETSGLIFNFQRFSLHDGPGIRTIVFFKGCPLHCYWCSNPESQSPHPQLTYNEEICMKCATCIKICPNQAITKKKNNTIIINRSQCQNCGLCSQYCPTTALQMKGKYMTIDQVTKEIDKDIVFYKTSEGGVTISGGEPLFQHQFLKNLLKECHIRGIHTVVETSGVSLWHHIKAIIPYTDLFFYDLKIMDRKQHYKYTGSDNEFILENLIKLQEKTHHIVIRVPIIPGINDSDENLSAFANFLKTINFQRIDLLPYHRYGEKKYEMLGKLYLLKSLETPAKKEMSLYQEKLKKYGFKVKVVDL